MATQRVTQTIGMTAASDISTSQYFILEVTAADTVDVCNAATDVPFGVLQNEPGNGETAEVAYADGDITKVVSDGSGTAISVGDQVGTDGNGRAVVKGTSGNLVLGRALAASDSQGEIIPVVISKGHVA